MTSENSPSALYRGEKQSMQFVQDRLDSGQDRLGRNGYPLMVIFSTGDQKDPIQGTLITKIITDVEKEHQVPIHNQLLLPCRLPDSTGELSLSVYELV